MVDYVRLHNTTLRLLEKNGTPYVYERFAAGSGDKPWEGPEGALVEETTEQPTIAVSPAAALGMKVVSEDLLARAEIVLITSVPEGAPDLLLFNQARRPGKENYRIEWVEKLEPADRILLYYIGAKR